MKRLMSPLTASERRGSDECRRQFCPAGQYEQRPEVGMVWFCGLEGLNEGFSGGLSLATSPRRPKQFQKIMSSADQLPFRLSFLKPAEQKGTDTAGGLDLPKNRLDNRFAHLVYRLPCFRFQLLFHLLHCRI